MAKIIVALLLLAVAAMVIATLKKRGAAGDGGTWPFYAKKPLSQPEQVLYHRLVGALSACNVLAQVQLSRVLGVKQGHNFHEWNNSINRMSLDFVICLKDGSVVAAIELDDKTHEQAARREADAKKEKALTDAGIRLIRWKTQAMPDEATIWQALAA